MAENAGLQVFLWNCLLFLGYPILHWCSHKPIPLIFCCSWRKKILLYCYLKLQCLKVGTEKMHSPWAEGGCSVFDFGEISREWVLRFTELSSMCLILFSPSQAVPVHIRTHSAAPLCSLHFLIIFLYFPSVAKILICPQCNCLPYSPFPIIPAHTM